MKISITLLVFYLLSICSCKDSYANEEKKEATDSLAIENDFMLCKSKTSKMLEKVIMNGDFDYDFANMMIIHHQMAIDMSIAELEKGSDKTIKTMANKIIVAQETEIKLLQQFVENYKISVANNKTSKSYKIASEMKIMIKNIDKIKMTKNNDKDYVSMMITHHKSAVAMAKNQVKYGSQQILIELSKNIIDVQTYEISFFKKWQSYNNKKLC